MFIETTYHPEKLSAKRNYLQEILPHRRHLIILDTFLPGEGAEGWAEFKKDINHFPNQPVLLASEIAQTLLEISEIAIRSNYSIRHLVFLCLRINLSIRVKIPIENRLILPVSAKKLTNVINPVATPSRTFGKIKAQLLTPKKTKALAEAIISFKLQ